MRDIVIFIGVESRRKSRWKILDNGIYVKLEDVLALLPEDDTVGPKPTYLREKIIELPAIIITELEDDTK
jgi:hypothetical protein